ncbi:hypothetical protein SJDPG2_09715 [Porphyromonas gingivalis SJD2]|nr:hypothetical protein SJDPG2_09715 [Porphyromonas gingivalis SJD2]
MIAAFTNESGQDSLKASIEANYKQIKQEVLTLVDEEVRRIKEDTNLCCLIKE